MFRAHRRGRRRPRGVVLDQHAWSLAATLRPTQYGAQVFEGAVTRTPPLSPAPGRGTDPHVRHLLPDGSAGATSLTWCRTCRGYEPRKRRTASTRRWSSGRSRQTELREDVRHVLLDRARRDEEPLPDRMVRTALRHQLENLALARREPLDRVVATVAADELATTSGSSAEPPSATRRTAAVNSSTSATRSLSR